MNNRKKRNVSNEASAELQSGSHRKEWLLLAACLVILIVGFSIRFSLSKSHAQQIRILQTQLEQARQSGDWPQVELLARDWATRRPLEYQPWGYAADAALAMHNFEMAAAYLSRIPDDSPADAFHQLGVIQMEQLNEPQAAIETCKRTLKVYPADSEAHERLLFFYTMTCQRDAIAEEAHRAIDAGSDTLATYAYLLGARWLTFRNGYDMNHLWLESDPSSELFEVAAVIHLIAKRDLGAITSQDDPSQTQRDATADAEVSNFYEQQVRDLRKKYPENTELLAAEIAALCKAGDVKQVALRLADAPSETAADNRFWRFKGWFHSSREEWSEAQAAYETGLQLYPFDWATEFELVAALRAGSDIESIGAMQERALLSQKLTRAIQLSNNIYQLEPASLYDEMQRYFRMCDQEDLAKSLGRRLASPQ